MQIKYLTSEQDEEIDNFLKIRELINKLNEDPHFKKEYRNIVIVSILKNTTKSKEEILEILDEIRGAFEFHRK